MIADPATPTSLELALRLLRDGRDELRRADEKASSLLTAVGVAGSVLLAGAFGRSWTPAVFQGAELAAWWSGLTAAAAAIGCLVSTLLPRLPTGGGTAPLTSFVEVAQLRRRSRLRTKTADPDLLKHAISLAAEDVFQHTMDQVRIVSWIVFVKYRRIRAAIHLMAVAATCMGSALALQLVVVGPR